MAKGISKAARKSRGRPALPPEAGKRFALGIRTTKELKEKIAAASHSSGRSVAQEIENRLERSFQEDAALGGSRTASLLRVFAGLAAQEGGGDTWLDDFYAFDHVTGIWASMIEHQRPHAPPEYVQTMERITPVIEQILRPDTPEDERARLRDILEIVIESMPAGTAGEIRDALSGRIRIKANDR